MVEVRVLYYWWNVSAIVTGESGCLGQRKKNFYIIQFCWAQNSQYFSSGPHHIRTLIHESCLVAQHKHHFPLSGTKHLHRGDLVVTVLLESTGLKNTEEDLYSFFCQVLFCHRMPDVGEYFTGCWHYENVQETWFLSSNIPVNQMSFQRNNEPPIKSSCA